MFQRLLNLEEKEKPIWEQRLHENRDIETQVSDNADSAGLLIGFIPGDAALCE